MEEVEIYEDAYMDGSDKIEEVISAQMLSVAQEEISEIYAEKSKNKQLEMLDKISKTTLIIIKFQLNKLITTNISKKKIEKDVEPVANDIKTIWEFLLFLANESTGKDKDIAIVHKYVETMNKYTRNNISEFIYQIATKSIPLRVGVSTVNKFINDYQKLHPDHEGIYTNDKDSPYDLLIPDFSVQLANNIDKLKQKDIDNLGRVYVTEKLDGVRVIAQYVDDENTFKLFSRSGKEFTGFNEIVNELNKMDKTYVYDGELLAINQLDKAEDTFRETMKIVGSKSENKRHILFNVFDMIPQKDFLSGGTNTPYEVRRQWVDWINGDYVVNVPVLMVTDRFEMIKERFNNLVKNGAEGVMLNKADAPYLTKRNNGILKFKQVYDSEGIVRDIFEGQGEAKGTLGGIIVQYHESTVRIGTGFTEKQRIDFWNNPDKIMNKLAQYRYTSVSHNQNDNGVSLRFARFITLRDDKTTQSFDN